MSKHEAMVEYLFQSTPPSRGATTEEFSIIPIEDISIHAPLAGGDRHCAGAGLSAQISIHAPLAGGDPLIQPLILLVAISIHAPLAGGDRKVHDYEKRFKMISIHAPLAGGDFRSCR